MIELLKGFPDNVVAAAASGHVTRADYERVLIPAVNAAFRRHRKVRFFYELRPTAIDAGAVWDDFKVGMEHLLQWERIAAVTDVDWIRSGVNLFRPFVPGEMRVFGMDQADEARRWIAGDS